MDNIAEKNICCTVDGVDFTHADIITIAERQRGFLFVVLVSLLCIGITAFTGKTIILPFLLGLLQLVCFVRLRIAEKSSVCFTVIGAILCCVPYLNLLVVVAAVCKATCILTVAGLSVRFMGVPRKDIEKFRSDFPGVPEQIENKE
jgi:hypothetical protein